MKTPATLAVATLVYLGVAPGFAQGGDPPPCSAGNLYLDLDDGYRVSMCIVASGEVHHLAPVQLAGDVAVFGRRNDPKALVKLVGGCTWGAIAAVTTARRLQIRVENRANGRVWTHNHNRAGLAPSAYSGSALCDARDLTASSFDVDNGSPHDYQVQVRRRDLKSRASFLAQAQEGDTPPCTATGPGLNLNGYQVFMCIVANGVTHHLTPVQLADDVAVFGRRNDPKALVKLVGGCTWGAIAAVTTARRLQIRVENRANGRVWTHNHNRAGLAPSAYSGSALCDGAWPDLTVSSFDVDKASLTTGDSFTLRATVRNQGAGSSTSTTTLRYYQSTDATISSSDTPVGTDAVGALSASATSAESIVLTAPSTPGTYYYGACVDSVSGESATGNNCSSGARVTVSGSSGGEVTEYRFDDGTFEESHIFVDSSGDPVHEQEIVERFPVNRDGTARYVEIFMGRDQSRGAGGESPVTLNFYRDSNGEPGTRIATVTRSPTFTPGTFSSVKLDLTSSAIPVATDCWVGIQWENSTGLALGVDTNGPGGGKPTVRTRDTSSARWSRWSGYPDDANVKSVGIRLGVGHGVSETAKPDLIVSSASVSDNSVATGESLDLSATVQNQGSGSASAATLLRFYRSSDSTIETSDVQVDTVALGVSLSSGITLSHGTVVSAPSTAGTYYYGACVDVVAGETNTANNCSSGVRVAITESEEDSAEFDLDSDNSTPRGIAYAGEHFYVTDQFNDKVYAYDSSGNRASSYDFDLASNNASSEGITYAGGRFYVTDFLADKVYAYDSSGNRASSYDFTTDSGPEGITYAGGHFYVVDWRDDEVYAYDSSGNRVSSYDFDLDPGNTGPEGITYAGGRFYIVDGEDDKVYAYDSSGNRASRYDFDLNPDNTGPEGITYAGGHFYVVDGSKVYAYEGRLTGDFDLDDGFHGGITYAEGRFYVTGNGAIRAYYRSGNRAYSYDFRLIASEPGVNIHVAPKGATYAAGRFYVVDRRKVWAFASNGNWASFSFDLDPNNGQPEGIAYTDGRFYVADPSDDKVYAYDGNGNRAERYDFDLDLETPGSFIGGITYADERFYLVYPRDEKVYAYDRHGNRASSYDFDLDSDQSAGSAIVYVDGRFYVADHVDDKVWAYDSAGNRVP